MKTSISMLLGVLALVVACDHGPRTELDPAVAGADALNESDDIGEDTKTDVEDDDDLPEDRFDVPPPVDFSCTKIDFLFVIDDSGSMGDEQERLIDGFPGFLSSVESAIAQYDYHMMVVTTGFAPSAGEAPSCDEAIGAGRIETGDGTECGVSDGEAEVTKRYADAETTDEETLEDVFSCVADVGVEGSGFEMPVWAMAQALTAHSKPGGCNEGFVRDDAILVVTIISDEEDDRGVDTPGDPELWKDVIVSAKHGRESDIVMLGLVGDTDLEDGVCEPFDPEAGTGAEGAPRLRELIESFQYGSWTSVCQNDYTPFFTDAVDDIGRACQDYIPAG